MIGYVYLTTNLINDKKYIGMHKKTYLMKIIKVLVKFLDKHLTNTVGKILNVKFLSGVKLMKNSVMQKLNG